MKLAAYFQVHGIKTSPNWLNPDASRSFGIKEYNCQNGYDLVGSLKFFVEWNKQFDDWIQQTIGITDRQSGHLPKVSYSPLVKDKIAATIINFCFPKNNKPKLELIDKRLSLFPEYLGYRAEIYREVHKGYTAIGGSKEFGILFIDAEPNGFYSFNGWLESKGYKHLIF